MNPSPGRHTFLLGLDAPVWTRGFDPDRFALRVQELMVELAPRASLDPAVSINPYAEWWQTAGLSNLLRTRYALMAAAAVFTDGTVSMSRFATLFATAFRDAGAGGDVVVVDLARKMEECQSTVFFGADSFGECCLQAPLTPRVAPLSISADRSGYRLLTRTTRPQGVQDQPVPSAIAPTSLSPLPTQTPAPSVTPAYSGSPDDAHIPDDPPGGDRGGGAPKSSFPWTGVLLGGTVLVGGLFAASVARRRGLLGGAPADSRPNPGARRSGRIPTFREYMAVDPKEFDRRNYGGSKGTFVWMGMEMPEPFREPADHGAMGDPYNGRVVPRKYLKAWQARLYSRHYPDAPEAEHAAAQAFGRNPS